jgi:hypothetical protein
MVGSTPSLYRLWKETLELPSAQVNGSEDCFLHSVEDDVYGQTECVKILQVRIPWLFKWADFREPESEECVFVNSWMKGVRYTLSYPEKQAV